jgi:lysophospholipid acyltransferase (LPLAT)-like uncharacterized protein
MSKVKVYLLALLIYLITRILSFTYRYQFIGFESFYLAEDTGRGGIVVFWHGHQLFMYNFWHHIRKIKSFQKLYALTSAHQDGQIAATVIKLCGINSVAGSSSKGGVKALRELIRLVNLGNFLAITPDGPKGPIYQVKPGTVLLAKECNVKVFPIGLTSTNSWKLNSWDKMDIPKPFSKVILKVAEPLTIDRSVSVNAGVKLIETALENVNLDIKNSLLK